MTPERFDAIVIGAGQAGKPLAIDLAAAGRNTALIEAKHVGGTCVNVGCTPTKTMVASARVAYLARRASDFGVETAAVHVDLAKVRARQRRIVERFRKGSEQTLLETPNLSLVRGRARFVAPREIEVALPDGSVRSFAAASIVINTGARPARPEIPGIDDSIDQGGRWRDVRPANVVPAVGGGGGAPPTIDWFDSTSILELDRLPRRLVVLGGGYIGLEFAQMFRRLGSEVEIVQRGPQLLPTVDPDVASAVLEVLHQEGVLVRLGTRATGARRGPSGLLLSVLGPDGPADVEGSHLLAAVGRVPNTEDLGLSDAGVEVDAQGFIRTNEFLETTAPGVHVAGDVKGGPAFTHISWDDYRVLRRHLLEGGRASISGRLVPWTVFIDPELAHVGMNEADARASGRPIRVAKMPMKYVARAIEMGETRGFMKAIVEADSKRILGFTVLGVGGGELAAVVQMAMQAGLPYTALEDTIFTHPIMAECLNNLFGWLE